MATLWTAASKRLAVARPSQAAVWPQSGTPPVMASARHTFLNRVKGRTLDDVLTIRNSEIAKHLSLPPVKLHCSMLAEDAIKAAVKDIKAKRAAHQPAAATA